MGLCTFGANSQHLNKAPGGWVSVSHRSQEGGIWLGSQSRNRLWRWVPRGEGPASLAACLAWDPTPCPSEALPTVFLGPFQQPLGDGSEWMEKADYFLG